MDVPRKPSLIVFEPADAAVRLAPSAPLGPWAQAPLERLLRAADCDRPVVLDLHRAPVSTPAEVAAVLWANDVARELGLRLEIVTHDPIGAELLDFAGVEAPVHAAARPPAVWPEIRRASAY